MQPVWKSWSLSQLWKNASPFFVCVPPHMQLTYYNILPDVLAAAANLVDVPITSTGALDAAQIEEEIPALDFSSDSESDSERGQTRPDQHLLYFYFFFPQIYPLDIELRSKVGSAPAESASCLQRRI